MVTSSNAAEWDAVLPATRGLSHRSTTSSRLPGRVLEGTVSYEVHQVVRCPNCGFMRRDLGGPHAPRLNARLELVDCGGSPLNRAVPWSQEVVASDSRARSGAT